MNSWLGNTILSINKKMNENKMSNAHFFLSFGDNFLKLSNGNTFFN